MSWSMTRAGAVIAQASWTAAVFCRFSNGTTTSERARALIGSYTGPERGSKNPNGIPAQSPALERSDYAGNATPSMLQPQRGCALQARPRAATPMGLKPLQSRFPRVARASQPWAFWRNPFGIRRTNPRAVVGNEGAGGRTFAKSVRSPQSFAPLGLCESDRGLAPSSRK